MIDLSSSSNCCVARILPRDAKLVTVTIKLYSSVEVNTNIRSYELFTDN